MAFYISGIKSLFKSTCGSQSLGSVSGFASRIGHASVLPTFLACLMSIFHVADAQVAQSLLGYRDGVSFWVDVPLGWSSDATASNRLGSIFMLLPAGHTFDSAPYVIYSNMIAGSTLQAAMDSDAREFRANDTNLIVSDRTGFKSKSGETFKLREFKSVKLRQQGYEAIAYLPRDNNVLLFVFSAQSDSQYAKGLPIFLRFLSTYSSSALKVRVEK